MKSRIFLATTGDGLARIELDSENNSPGTSSINIKGIHCLEADPLQPGVVYAGTQDQGVLKSLDSGKTWEPVGLIGQPIKALTTSLHQPGTLYAGTRPAGLFTSSDGGETWEELEAFQRIPGRWWWFSPASLPFTAYVQAISVSPNDPETLIVGIEFGAVVRSQDGGQTWSKHSKGALRDCHNLTFHSSDGNYVYQAGGGGASISRNGGQTWIQPKDGLDRRYGWACAADPGDPDIWYVSASPFIAWKRPGPPAAHVEGYSNASIFRSKNGGIWQKLNGGLPQPLEYMANALLTDPANPGHLYTGLSNGTIWHSVNYGDSWEQLPVDLDRIYRLLLLPG